MEISFLFQYISLLVMGGYVSYDSVKRQIAYNELRLLYYKERDINRDFYELSNDILLEILNDMDNSYLNFSNPLPNFEDVERFIYCSNTNYELTHFIYRLISYIGVNNLSNLAHNIGTLNIVYDDDLGFEPLLRTLGYYNTYDNTIYIYHRNSSTLAHEFLHAASTTKVFDYFFVGFCADNEEERFFHGFNEGYTEILSKRILGSSFIGYGSNYIICKLLETLFDDRRELEIAYFNNDTRVFINKFLEYGSVYELSEILRCLDVFATTPITKDDENELIGMVMGIIKRKNESHRILECEKILDENNCLNKRKKLVKRF